MLRTATRHLHVEGPPPQLMLLLQVGLAAKAAMIWVHQAANIQDEEAVAELTAALQVCSLLCPLIGLTLMLLKCKVLEVLSHVSERHPCNSPVW